MGALLSCCFEDTSQRETPISERIDRQSCQSSHCQQADQVLHLVVNENQAPSNVTQRSSNEVRHVRSRSKSPGQNRGGRRGARQARHYSMPHYHKRFYPDEPHLHLEPLHKISQSEIKQYMPKWWSKKYNETEFGLEELIYKKSYTFLKISTRFQRTVKNNLDIESLHRVENVYLWLMYQLKLQEISAVHEDAKEWELFHGTPAENVPSICSANFNWRQHGDSTGHRWFGKGVSFSPLASYSSHYTDKNEGSGNKMFLAKVIVTNKCEGVRNMSLPPHGFDTTTNSEEKVFVKYDDHTFYPEYVITYAGNLDNLNLQNKENVIAPAYAYSHSSGSQVRVNKREKINMKASRNLYSKKSRL
jgi:hypothetical protein